MKNKKSYTKKWLNHYHNFWHEEPINYYFDMIVIDKADAPKVVKERVHQINMRRYEKGAKFSYELGYSISVFAKACKRIGNRHVPIKLFINILNDEKAREDRYWERIKPNTTSTKNNDDLPIIYSVKEFGDKTNEDDDEEKDSTYEDYDRYYADDD